MYKRIPRHLRAPVRAMTVVLFMYIFKAIAKIWIGNTVHSPMISGDGWHNVADLFQAFAVIAVIIIAAFPRSKEYPFGRKNIEFFTALIIGVVLSGMAVQFALKSLAGLMAQSPAADALVRGYLPFLPEIEPLSIDSTSFWIVVGVTSCSVILSHMVGRYQVSVGRTSGHTSMVADGEETQGDGWIELVILIGVVSQKILSLVGYGFLGPWIEYPLGLLVSCLILRTGCELFMGAWRVLLQHSLGSEREGQIRERCMSVAGVVGINKLTTFQVGHIAVVLVEVVTRRGEQTNACIKHAIEQRLSGLLLGDTFKECEVHIRFRRPEPERHRIGIGVERCADGSYRVADTAASITHVYVCDVEDGSFSRIKDEPVACLCADAGEQQFMNVLARFLARKRIQKLYVMHRAEKDSALLGVELLEALSPTLEVLGAPSRRRDPRWLQA